MPLTELARERQTHRFYEPWVNLQSSSHLLDQTVSDVAGEDHTPRLSKDKVLTAFAQLATFRLNVKRCMVSLIDTQIQYILAEATKTVSLGSESRRSSNDRIWLGSSSLLRKEAVCSCTFDSEYMANDADGNKVTTDALVVGDMRRDQRFMNREYVKNGTVLFYAGVPIKTRNGINIGVYAVSDDRVRIGLDLEEIRFMQDIAAAVFEHLELTKLKLDSIRGERMVRSLTAFIEGHSSIAEEEAVDHKSRGNQITLTNAAPPKAPRSKTQVQPKEERMKELFTRAANMIRDATETDGVVFLDATSQYIETQSTDLNIESDISAGEKTVDTDSSGDETTVQRPARVFRKSVPRRPRRRVSTSDDENSPTRQGLCAILAASVDSSDDDAEQQNRHLTISKKDLKRCIQRYPRGRCFNLVDDNGTSSSDDTGTEITDNAHADELSKQQERNRNRYRRRTFSKGMAAQIMKNLPGVQTVVFLPIWDFSQDRWLSGLFIWSTQRGRTLESEDKLPYLKAFANSIISEIARMNTQYSERAKTTFIASISHELRSPLHGILGSIEFLHDTSVDAYQSSLINSVETCGKTLLDTINHVLDYAGINDFAVIDRTDASSRSLQLARVDSKTEMSLNFVTDFDLARLVEEVTDAIFAGRMFSKKQRKDSNQDEIRNQSRMAQYNSGTSPQTLDGAAVDGLQPTSRNIVVLLNVSKTEDWHVRAQPGALRRVIMNIFGNALKYTDRGYVEVSLKPKKETRNSRCAFELKLSDSGRGMSEAYQREKLFKPFSQEDPFTEGTGLGLSIVRQIVDTLKGRIKVKSHQGVGTEITVSLSLPASKTLSAETIESLPTNPLTRGLRLCLVECQSNEIRTHEASQRLARSLRETCVEWFEMEVDNSSVFDAKNADIALFMDCPSPDLLSQLGHKGFGENASGTKIPIIILCQNAYETVWLKKQLASLNTTGAVIEVFAQPCGPRKMAMVFEQCLRPNATPPSKATEPITTEADGTEAPTDPYIASVHNSTSSTTDVHRTSFTDTHTKTSSPVSASRHQSNGVSPKKNQTTERTEPLSINISNTNTDTNTNTTTTQPHTLKILLVDDNPINLQLLVTFMKKLKYTYVSASNGLDALNLFKAADAPFDFCLMDISMPIMDGLTATRGIRQFEIERDKGWEKSGKRPSRSRILALTGLASASAREDAFASGVDQFLPKPVVFKDLQALLKETSVTAERHSAGKQ